MFFAALLTVAIGSASYSREFVAEGKTYSALGDYKIEIADNPVIINGDETIIASFLHGKVVDMLYFPIVETHYPGWFPVFGGEEFIFFRPVFYRPVFL